MMKGLLALLLVSCAIAVASADFSPFPFAGTYRDSRFGGYAYLCNTDDKAQGSASGQLFFVDNTTGTDYRPTLSGSYWSANAGKAPEYGTFELTLKDNGNYVGWYFRKGDSADAWPWVLTRLSRDDVYDLPSGHCLDSNQYDSSDSVSGAWTIGSSLNTIQLCIDKHYTEGTIFNGDNVVSYLYGQSYENGNIFVGRQYQAGDEDGVCTDFGNVIYRVVKNSDDSLSLVGFVTRGSLLNSPQIQYVQASNAGSGDSDKCDDGDSFHKCEAGVYFRELRSSASAVVSSLFAVAVFAVVAVLF